MFIPYSKVIVGGHSKLTHFISRLVGLIVLKVYWSTYVRVWTEGKLSIVTNMSAQTENLTSQPKMAVAYSIWCLSHHVDYV